MRAVGAASGRPSDDDQGTIVGELHVAWSRVSAAPGGAGGVAAGTSRTRRGYFVVPIPFWSRAAVTSACSGRSAELAAGSPDRVQRSRRARFARSVPSVLFVRHRGRRTF